jgi:hypothetical protein
LNDEDLLVRNDAIDVAVEIMQTKMQPEQIEKEFIPIFVKHLEVTEETECVKKTSAILGKFLFSLTLEKQRKTYAREFIDFFNRISRS